MTYQPPTHAYVPGKNERHAEDVFAEICQTVQPGMTADALASSRAFQHGLQYLKQGYFWEAHEVFEPVWMALDAGRERHFVQGLIQLANAELKARMDRPKAARRLCAIARGLVDAREDRIMGVSCRSVVDQIDALEMSLEGAD